MRLDYVIPAQLLLPKEFTAKTVFFFKASIAFMGVWSSGSEVPHDNENQPL